LILEPGVLWGLAAVFFTLLSMVPYIVMTVKGRNRPHIFSWIIWFLLTLIAFAIQYNGGAGAGAWATAMTALCCFSIIVVSIKNGEKRITRLDWVSFVLALSILPLWMLTENATLAAIFLVMIDGLGYVPTIRKAWHRPQEEMAYIHAVTNIKHVFSLFAMRIVSVPTVLYPLCLLVFNGVLVAIILGRRAVLARTA